VFVRERVSVAELAVTFLVDTHPSFRRQSGCLTADVVSVLGWSTAWALCLGGEGRREEQ